MLIGIAKPMPTEPLPPPVAIWELMPITRPFASISGPPELPGLMEASVWITFEIGKPLGALISRATAETMPVVTVRREAERVADRHDRVAHLGRARVAQRHRRRVPDLLGVHLEHREVGRRVATLHHGLDRVAVLLEAHRHVVRALDHVGVGHDRAVASTRKPEPVAVPCCSGAGRRARSSSWSRRGPGRRPRRGPPRGRCRRPSCRRRSRCRPPGGRSEPGARRSWSSPTSITSVEIRMAPATRTIRPPRAPDSEVRVGRSWSLNRRGNLRED